MDSWARGLEAGDWSEWDSEMQKIIRGYDPKMRDEHEPKLQEIRDTVFPLFAEYSPEIMFRVVPSTRWCITYQVDLVIEGSRITVQFRIDATPDAILESLLETVDRYSKKRS